MRARMLFQYKDRQGDVLVEMIIWVLPSQSRGNPHGLKYRLFCGRPDLCIVRYDNETAKGDHRHYGDYEERYAFESVEKLIEGFPSDCARLAGWRWEE